MKPPFDGQIAQGCLVRLPQDEGEHSMGVRVGNYVATACHCLPRVEGRVVLPNPDAAGEDVVLVEVALPSDIGRARGAVVSADPCSDFALISDSTRCGANIPPDEAERFLALLSSLRPARPNLAPSQAEERPVYFLTPEGCWLSGQASFGEIALDQPLDRVRPGTSGTPVFDENGLVLGVMSKGVDDRPVGRMALLVDSLPGWALQELAADDE